MESQKKYIIKGLIIIAAVVALIPNQAAFAAYHNLECSDFYNGYCDSQGCFAEYGDGSNFIDGFCYNVPYRGEMLNWQGIGGENPPDYATVTGQENQAIFLQELISGQKFIANVVGFWLPFGCIMIFSLGIIYMVLLKFKFFR